MIMRLEILRGEGYALRVPRSIATKLGAGLRQPIQVQVGGSRINARCTAGSAVATIALTEALLGKLALRRGMHLHVSATPGNLHIGPLVGILVPGTRGLPNPIGNMTLGMAYLIEQGRMHGVYAYVFTTKSIDFTRRVATGYTLVSWGSAGYRWTRRIFPLPDVVYDQITYRRRDQSSDVRKLRQKLTELQIPYFNTGYFNKWEVHNWLSRSEELQAHLPETQLLSAETLADMSTRHKRLFIKPAHGSLGRNIVVVTRHSENSFSMRRGRFASSRVELKDLASIPDRLPKLKNDFYIVQQGLELCHAHGRRRDIRVIIQRGKAGKWLVSALFARVAPGGSLVANITAGATGTNVTRALRKCFSAARVNSIVYQLRRLSHRICDCLSETFGSNLGELGIDLGVDMKGHIWIIEVNSKPHRKADEETEENPRPKRTFRRPMQYAAYLAGFKYSTGKG